MKNVAALSHISDIDGVGAAALVRMRYGMPLENIFFAGHDRDEVKDVEAELRGLCDRGVLLFITDLSPNADNIAIYESLLKRIRSHGGGVVWLDHHVWPGKAAERLAKRCDVAVFGENSEMCATQLVHRFLRLDSKFANEFADMIHYIDLFLPTDNEKYKERSEEYKLAIDYCTMSGQRRTKQSRLRRIAGVISSGRFLDGGIHRDALKFKVLNQKRIALLLDNLAYISKKVVIGFSKEVDSTDACHEMLQKTGANVAMLIKTDSGHCSIRSKKGNTVPLANALGGGGHPHASGFSVDLERYNFFRTKRDRTALSNKLADAARKSGLL